MGSTCKMPVLPDFEPSRPPDEYLKVERKPSFNCSAKAPARLAVGELTVLSTHAEIDLPGGTRRSDLAAWLDAFDSAGARAP